MNKPNPLVAALFFVASFGLAVEPGVAAGDSSDPPIKYLSLENYSMPFIDTGNGEPVIFVHGAVGDLRSWSAYLKPISAKHRFISYTRRWYGEQDWPGGKPVYSHDQHALDLAKLIESLDAGPVHLVTWSSGAINTTILAAERPELIKSIVHFEPVLDGVMEGVPEAEKLGADWRALWGPVVEAAKAGDNVLASQRLIELVFELPDGGFDSMPTSVKEVVLNNSRTVPLLFFNNETKTSPDCDYLNNIEVPTAVVLGADTNPWWSLMSETVSACMPNASLRKIEGVNHNGPIFAVDEIVSVIEQMVLALQ